MQEKLELPPIPGKLYFSLEEASTLCAVKPQVLLYWEREFPQLAPERRKGNQRRYRQHDIVLVRKIRQLLYGMGLSIEVARHQLAEGVEDSYQASKSVQPLLSEIVAELEEVLQLLK